MEEKIIKVIKNVVYKNYNIELSGIKLETPPKKDL
jgi:hypothetical protein